MADLVVRSRRLDWIPSVIVAVLLLLSTSVAATPAATPAATATAKPAAATLTAEQRVQVLQRQLREATARLQKLADERNQIDTDYARKYYDHMGERADMNLAQLNWQLRASEKMLWVVVLVVFSGVVFSGFQLWKSTTMTHLVGETTVVIEAQRIRVRSSIVGVVVLAISMAFFYAFLVEVYRMRVVDLSGTEVPPSYRADTHPPATGTKSASSPGAEKNLEARPESAGE